jgi:undecaprenyl diphosphate synthase
MDLLRTYLKKADNYHKDNVRTRILGDIAALDSDLQELIADVEKGSADKTGINLNIALNYGGRDEMVHAARLAAQKILAGEIALQQIDQKLLTDCMYTAGQPDVDLIIRTGGESRLSNFLLWQSAYAELVFVDTYWPDFGTGDLDLALEQFGVRRRTMGGV